MSLERRAALYLCLIFVSGLLCGGTLMNLAEHYWLHVHQRNEYDISEHRRIAAEMRRNLNLTAAQEAQVDAILRATVREYRGVESAVEPQFDQVRAQGRAQLRALLNPGQRAAFDAIVRRVDREFPEDQRPASLPVPCPVPIDASK